MNYGAETNTPFFMHLPSLGVLNNGAKTINIDNMTYDKFLLNDLTRVAALLCLNDGQPRKFHSSDDVFESYLRFANVTSMLEYFLENFEHIILMYIYSRFGKIFEVSIERVNDPVVKFPIGCYTSNTHLVVLYTPARLQEYIERLSMSIFLYATDSEDAELSATVSRMWNVQRVKRPKNKRLEELLQVDERDLINGKNQLFPSFHNTLPVEIGDFMSGVNGLNKNDCKKNQTELRCSSFGDTTGFIPINIDRQSVLSDPFVINKTHRVEENLSFLSSSLMPTFKKKRTNGGTLKDTEDFNKHIFRGNEVNPNLETIHNYLESQQMMLQFNSIFCYGNRTSLIYLAGIRTILSTAIRPIVDQFVISNDRTGKPKPKMPTPGTKNTQDIVNSDQPAILRKNKIDAQKTTELQPCLKSGTGFSKLGKNLDIIYHTLKQQRLNIDVCVRN